ncbi:MAG: SDR family oxidoreductase [Gammaproteobacteria bacterium]|nr:SDR family oxidoreductase [Gammaproteobacteria bacterium]
MDLRGKRVVLTGAAGGMGQLIAQALADRGASLVLADANNDGLQSLLGRLGESHEVVAGDLTRPEVRTELVNTCRRLGTLHMLINAAGISDYVLLEQHEQRRIELMMSLNATLPILLCQELLPFLRASPEALIVNFGSTFGSIGHPGFAVYCATKFALRGFSESLRRELADTHVGVIYFAPRATRTGMNSSAVDALNAELGNAMDSPESVAAALIDRIQQSSGGDYYLGWPEKLFVRLNGLLPGVVDGALRKQLAIIKRLAAELPAG